MLKSNFKKEYRGRRVVHLSVTLSIFFFVSFFFVTHQVSAATLSKPQNNLGLLLYLPMNEGTSTIVHDFSGRGNNGTMSTSFAFPPTATSGWGNGKHDKAINFDGVNARVYTGTSTLNNIGVSTYSAWIYPRSEGRNSRGGIFNKATVISSPTPGPEWEFGNVGLDGIDRTNALAFFVPFTTTALIRIASDNTITLNKWQFVTVTWDGSTSSANVHIYVNGVEVTYQKSQDASGTQKDDSGGGMSIGTGQYAAQPSAFDGFIDDFRVYNRVLSITEINSLYKAAGTRLNLPTNTGLVGFWNLNEGTSTVAHDFSGKQNHGTLLNFANPATTQSGWGYGKRGQALVFDNTNDKVQINPSNSINNLTTFSASMWIKPNSLGGSNNGVIINKIDTGSTVGWQLRLNTNNQILFTRLFSTQMTAASASNVVKLGQWQHVLITHDGSNTAANTHIYVNGVETSYATQTNGTGGTTDDSSVNMYIGDLGNDTREFDGTIDDVRLYNRVLSSDEIRNMYKTESFQINSSKNTKFNSGIIGLWSFDGQDTDWQTGTAYDASGNNSKGRFVGMATSTATVAGKIGQAFQFYPNTTNYITVGTPSTLNTLGAFSVSLWMKPNSLGNSNAGTLLNKGSIPFSSGWILKMAASNEITFSRFFAGQMTTTSGANSITLGQWQHILISHDGTGTAANTRIFVNGVETSYATQTNSAGSASNDSGNAFIIGDIGDGTQEFDGRIDDVRIYNRAMNVVDAKKLYLMGK